MDEINDLLERSLFKLGELVEYVEEIKGLSNSHKETMDDVLYELQEIKTTLEDQIEE